MGIAFAGSAETAAALVDEYRKRNIDSKSNVDELANEIAKVSADLFGQCFREIRPAERAGVVLLVAGYRRAPGALEAEPLIYMLNSQANFAPGLAPETMMAGVPQYAVYLFHRYYDRNITLERARALAEYPLRKRRRRTRRSAALSELPK
jgi:hypothetical protein